MPQTATLEEQLKTIEEQFRNQAPRIDGLVQEDVITLNPGTAEIDPLVQIIMPFSSKSNYESASAHKDAVDKLSKPLGIDDKYNLLGSVRKLANIYKTGSVIADISGYLRDGLDKIGAKANEIVAQLQEEFKDNKPELEKRIEQLKEELKKAEQELPGKNLAKHGKNIDTLLKNVNSAFAEAPYAAKVTPPVYDFDTMKYRNLEQDITGKGPEAHEIIEELIKGSKHADTHMNNLVTGQRIYILRYAKVQDQEGRDARQPIALEIWKRKD